MKSSPEIQIILSFKLRYVLVFLSLLLASPDLLAQSSYQAGLLPAVNLNRKLPRDWKVNLKIESRQQVQQGRFGAEASDQYDYLLTDFAMVASKKVGFGSSLAGGYLLRFRDDRRFHRSIQQLTFARAYGGLRLAHRVAADQTFAAESPTEWRLRYRVTLERALSGQAVDAGEWYLKVNHEYLHSLQDGDYDLEVRLVPLLGFEITARSKIETGLDYRVNSFINDDPSHRFWASINWYMSF